MQRASSGSLSARGPPRNGAATPPQHGKPSSSASQQQCHSARANVGSTPTRRSDLLLLPSDVARSNERDLSTSPNARAKQSKRTAPELTAKRQSYTPPPAGVPVATRRCNQTCRVMVMTAVGVGAGYWARLLQETPACATSSGTVAQMLSSAQSLSASLIAWSMDDHGADACKDGLLLAGPTPSPLNVAICMLALLWAFLGVMIAADAFMVAIERITSQETKVMRKVNGQPKEFTVLVWNATVANLTLMALGSSAPEILLSTIEIVSSGFYAGELGPSTIVGSAAYNLMIISAVCVTSLPPGERKKINDLGVFALTAVFSLFAYVWLLIILQVSSPNIIEPWEGGVTFFFFPLLVGLAYLADVGVFKCIGICAGAGGAGASSGEVVALSHEGKEILLDKAMDIIIRAGGDADAAAEDLAAILAKKKTRALYRVSASRSATMGRLPVGQGKALISQFEDGRPATFQFRHSLLTLPPGQKWVDVHVDRSGSLELPCSVRSRSVGQSGGGEARSEGAIEFAPGQAESYVRMTVLDSESAFYVVLVEPSPGAVVGAQWNCAVLVEHAHSAGVLKFEHERMSIKESEGVLWVTVKRVGGSTGKIKFTLRTKDLSAVAGADYVAVDHEVFMASGQTEHTFPVHVFDDDVFEQEETFQIILSDPQGGATFDPTTNGGGEQAIATVTIISDELVRRRVDEIASLVRLNAHDLGASRMSWAKQFREAFEYEGSPTCAGVSVYLLALPWKVLLAFTPPVRLWNGWLAFSAALGFIGILTAVIGDLATHLGCTMGLLPSITAITFIAMGTSLPDTFASRTAAMQEPCADSSIGNITGSNSVNVFFGLGLPWALAAFYWRWAYSADAEATWRARFADAPWYSADMPVAFVVEAAELGFSVLVFSLTALPCLGVLVLRRAVSGYELGGDSRWAWLTAIFFVLLWMIYIGMSVAFTYGYFE